MESLETPCLLGPCGMVTRVTNWLFCFLDSLNANLTFFVDLAIKDDGYIISCVVLSLCRCVPTRECAV